MTIRRRLATAAFAITLSSGTFAGVAAAAPAPSAPAPARAGSLASRARAALTALDWVSLSGDLPALNAYAAQRDALAADVAAGRGVDPVAMQDAWRSADLAHQAALLAALSQLGVRYRRNASIPGVAFDCSGLTSYAWGQAGYGLAHQSGSQIRAADRRNADTAQAGDLIYYPGHVMMYLGAEGLMVHSPYTGTSVRIDNLPRRNLRWGDPTG